MNSNTVSLKENELLALVDKNRALDATYKLIEIILGTNDFDEMSQKIADIIPMALGYEFSVLWLVDEQKQKLVKTAISQTIKDDSVMRKLKDSLRNTSIALGYEDNLCVRSIKDKKQYMSESLFDLLGPSVSLEDSKGIQKLLGTKLNIATPLTVRDRVIGVLIVSMSKTADNISDFEKEMLRKFSENAGIALENSRLYKNLKEAKDDLNEAYENLMVLNKMKDEFLTVASHELRTPMTIVKSYLWMINQHKTGRLNGKQKEYIQKAERGTQRMIDLINDMLNISRFEHDKVEFKLTQTDLCQLIKEILTSFEIKVKNKGIDLSFSETCLDVFVDIDKEKMRDVITNLIDNAVKFTDNGEVKVSVENEEDKVVIQIKDSGSGINPPDLPKLFHKFGRIDNSYTIASDTGGTGLGLYIVKLYVEGMGGRVWATSDGVDKGSSFWVSIPKTTILKPGEKIGNGSTKTRLVPVQQITSLD
jgi:signal transduction histidine kinase